MEEWRRGEEAKRNGEKRSLVLVYITVSGSTFQKIQAQYTIRVHRHTTGWVSSHSPLTSGVGEVILRPCVQDDRNLNRRQVVGRWGAAPIGPHVGALAAVVVHLKGVLADALPPVDL